MERHVGCHQPDEGEVELPLVGIPIAIYAKWGLNSGLTFIASMIAIMPLAFLMGKATEEIALRTSESIGGLLNATFGNAAEMIIAGAAIFAAAELAGEGEIAASEDMINIVRASLVGSILGNLLLVLGLAFVWGGIHHKEQSFSPTAVGAKQHLTIARSGDLDHADRIHLRR
ncbi:MAG: hypothetical protein Ct9H90mP16_09190 [Candidatus Poseidoniales archaeon]|nr:MAG: hypothetical protein Ct9H90mP16_09190 [Candidatus Poseidoniales archaeon]